MPTPSGIIVSTTSEASGRRTLLDIVDELARPVDASDTTVRALAGDAFRAAVRTMNRKGLWPWEAQDQDVAITANNAFSTVVGAIKKPLSMHYLTATGGTPFQHIAYTTYDRFLEMYTLDITAKPYLYTIPNLFETGQIRWFPRPGTDLSARFAFYRVTPAPRVESEAVEIPDHAIEAYMALAWYELMKRLPAGQRVLGLDTALIEARAAFRELSAHVNAPGDRTRQITVTGLI